LRNQYYISKKRGATIASGYRVTDGLYVVGSFVYTRDMMRGYGININFYSPSLLAGVRWYPTRNHKFLQFGLDIGPTWLLFRNNIPGIRNQTGIGVGINGTVAMDFNSSLNGPHWQLCGNIFYSNINGGSTVTPGITVKICYKRTKNMGDDDFDPSEAVAASAVIWPSLLSLATLITFSMMPGAL
jgi:hypothetical protein